jgi:hypothetical protein
MSLDPTTGETKQSGKTGLIVLIMTVAHTLFYFAPDLYVPFNVAELFLLGYALVLVDSGLIAFLAIKLLIQVHTQKKSNNG